jgi:hypothetical protein
VLALLVGRAAHVLVIVVLIGLVAVLLVLDVVGFVRLVLSGTFMERKSRPTRVSLPLSRQNGRPPGRPAGSCLGRKAEAPAGYDLT